MLKIYNTLTKTKEEFKAINPPEIKMYICGPTVYDFFHIGNARTFLMADIIRRYLESSGYNVKYVMNLTDIDDKIIKKAGKEHKSSQELSEYYSNAFFEDIDKLKIKRATEYPRATTHISEIINFIKKLEDKKIAYNVKGDVFYDVSKFKEYGRLSGKKIDELEVGARVEENKNKKNPLDFALWKKAKEGEPYWESPWGKGRPGWHIECSAMSCLHLGETFDIHAGGSDLIFPHHENEIAQSEAANDKKFVNYWIHFGFLNINEEKMSKSLGNFFTAREVTAKYPAEVVRLFFIQTNYGGPLNFSDELLAASQKGLEKISNLNEKIESELVENKGGNDPGFNFNKYYDDFKSAMDDDFNSPQAIAVIFDFVREVNRILAENQNLSLEFYQKAKEFLNATADRVFGILPALTNSRFLNENALMNLTKLVNEIDGSFSGTDLNSDNIINFLIEERLKAKKNKDFPLSDKIRDVLKDNGVLLQDAKDKTTYKMLNA